MTSRHIVFALGAQHGHADRMTLDAVRALRGHADVLTVVHGVPLDRESAAALGELADHVLRAAGDGFAPSWYLDAIAAHPADEVLLTGDGVIGPVRSLDETFAAMADSASDAWQLIQNVGGPSKEFPEDGFPFAATPWIWTVVRKTALASPAWRDFWEQKRSARRLASLEGELGAYLERHGLRVEYGHAVPDFPSVNPALHDSELLLRAGSPFVSKAVFQQYPPILNRYAIIGRDIAQAIEATGYPMEFVWDSLARATPPKTLNTNGGLLEVLDDEGHGYDEAAPLRTAVIARVVDLSGLDELLERVSYIPGPVDLYVTTTEGVSAAHIERRLEQWDHHLDGSFEVRVTPLNPGRDMADFFVGCRDVLLSDRYDIIAKIHLREVRTKTLNIRRYFRRYQLENLLNSPGYARNLWGLFQREKSLGVAFPPMMQIGYATMGRGWVDLMRPAARLCRELGIRVPFDRPSPLAPYGGMFVARPQALRRMTERSWTFVDYRRHGQRGYPRLAHIQERLIAYAAAQDGFVARTVLSAEHASISHTAIEFKADELFSAIRGYPVDQIDFMHRAGYTGYGGPVALARMYLRANHSRAVSALRPLYHLALAGYGVARGGRGLLRRLGGPGRRDTE